MAGTDEEAHACALLQRHQHSPAMPTAAIIGAGITGLSAAQVLTQAGWQVQLFDKGRVPGGRFSTRELTSPMRLIDHGAQFLTARDPHFFAQVMSWEKIGWVRRWCDGIPLLTAHELISTCDGFPRWIGVGGMRGLAQRLAESFTLQNPATVTALRQEQNRWAISWVVGDAIRHPSNEPVQTAFADAVVLTQPAPQIITFLDQSHLLVPTELGELHYDPCLAVIIDAPQQIQAFLPNPGAVRIDDPASPLSWIASARARGQCEQGDALLLHATGAWTSAHDTNATELARQLLRDAQPTLERLLLSDQINNYPARAHRWKFSRCVKTIPQPFLSLSLPAPLVIAGDSFGDCPRVEGGWISGKLAAEYVAQIRSLTL
jgi:renalase